MQVKTPKMFALTPVGTVDYPFLNTPDTKYKAEGEFKLKLKLDKSPEADALFRQLSAAGSLAFDQAKGKAAHAGKRPPKAAELPIYDNGTQYVMTAKLKASGVNKATGQVFHQAPRLFDKNNKPWNMSTLVTHGSKLRICVELVAYDSPTTGAGITLRLKDVQILELGAGFNSESPFGAAPEPEVPSFGAVSQLGAADDDGDF